MRTSRKSRLGPDTAERLLTTGRDPAFPELSRLLTTASAPPRPHELTGLDAALAAFEEAGRRWRPAPVTRRRRMLRPFAMAVAACAVFAGGVAVAAETGNLPGTRPPAGERTTTTAGPPPGGTPTPPDRTGTPPATPAPGGRGPSLSPNSPAVPGLCRAWDAQRRNPNGASMKAQAKRDLAAVAGGQDLIPGFCAPRLNPPGNPHTTRPGTVPPTPSHPTGKGPVKPTPSTGRRGQDR